MTKLPSYRDEAGLTNRANSALLEIERINDDRSIQSAVRLVLIAERLDREPVLTDPSGAAIAARRRAGVLVARRAERARA